MIHIKCTAPDTRFLNQLIPFQGELKKRNEKDIKKLADSILEEGLLMPFAVWQHDDQSYILDGHGRMAALVSIALKSPDVLQQEFPCIVVQAESEDEAKKALLQITSTYGKVNPKGLITFASTVLDYHAPVLEKAQRKLQKSKDVVVAKKDNDRVILKISVAKKDVDMVKDILSKADYIKVL